MIVKIYSDSLGFPRLEDDTCYDQTYAGKLASHPELDIHLRGRGGFIASQIQSMVTMDARYSRGNIDELAILHFGIVDCAPRPIPRALRFLLSRLNVSIRSRFVRVIHFVRPYSQRLIFFRFTSPKRFRVIYSDLVQGQLQKNIKVICISIMDPSNEAEHHSPGLRKSVKEYNNLIKNVCSLHGATYIEVSDDESFLLRDGIHLSNKGHEEIYRLLMDNM